MIVVGLDPGSEQSALVAWDGFKIVQHDIMPNEQVLDSFRTRRGRRDGIVLAIEMIESMGMAVGKSVLDTVRVTGRFQEAWFPDQVELVGRHEIKLHHCYQRRAKDAEIRQAILDRFGSTKEKAIGKRTTPGPLFGIVSHEWSALAVALTWHDQHKDEASGPMIRPGVIAEF